VSAVVWDRAGASRAARRAARNAKNRIAGVVQALVGGTVGTLFLLFWHPLAAYVVLGISSVVLLSALLSPGGLYEIIRAGVGRFASFVGTVVAWLALLPVFYLFFTPFHFLFRRGARDAMVRSLDPGQPTYWNVRDGGPPDRDSYERQF
jgi:hypothetical protein